MIETDAIAVLIKAANTVSSLSQSDRKYALELAIFTIHALHRRLLIDGRITTALPENLSHIEAVLDGLEIAPAEIVSAALLAAADEVRLLRMELLSSSE